MSGRRRFAAALAVSLVLGGPAAANDSSSELAAGGLVLVKTDRIAMQREDLSIAPAEVRVRYEMRNDTGAPVTLRVAFPLPDLPKETPGGMETGTAHNIDIRPPSEANFIGFRVQADGQAVTPEVEIRAVLPDGRDVAEELRRIGGLSLLLRPRWFELPVDAAERTGPNGGWDLDAPTRQALEQLGALRQEAEGYEMLWTTRITFHWMQTFRPGVTVLEHSYRPVLGSQLIAALRPGQPDKADVQAGVWHGSLDDDLARAYCIDGPTDRAMRALYARKLRGRGGDVYVTAYVLGYILRTASNWRGPIGTFHLVLQGGPLDTGFAGAGEARLLSLCTGLPVRQTGKMRFEATARDYVPAEDLRLLILTDGQ